jgi:hypothetical protein
LINDDVMMCHIGQFVELLPQLLHKREGITGIILVKNGAYKLRVLASEK